MKKSLPSWHILIIFCGDVISLFNHNCGKKAGTKGNRKIDRNKQIAIWKNIPDKIDGIYITNAFSNIQTSECCK